MDFSAPDIRLTALLPTLVVSITALVVLARGVLGRGEAGGATRTSLFGLALAAAASLLAGSRLGPPTFADCLRVDSAAVVFYLVFLLATGLVLLICSDHLGSVETERAEAHALLLLACVGMMLLASSAHLAVIFLGLETMSIALYILAGLAGQRDRGSSEAALKYLLLGGFATGFLVYGMAFVYGGSGQLELVRIGAALQAGAVHLGYLNLGMALLIVGLGFKVALVPFHMWAPDVYEGAPTPVTAFMSVGPKLAGFAALVRVFDVGLQPVRESWLPVLWVLAVATMFVGNVVAIAQTNIKRMLAYSSIAHAGYLLVGVAAANSNGVQGVLYYALAYTLMNVGAFAVVIAVAGPGGDKLHLDDYQGLWKRSPVLATSLALFLFALAGLPPFSGFIGKWLLFLGAVQSGLVGLAVLGVLCSAISAFYYLRVVVLMTMREPLAEGDPLAGHTRLRAAVYIAAIGTLLCGFPVGLWLTRLAAWGAGGL